MEKEVFLQLYQVSKGIYHTKDDRFRIEKENNTWSWFIKSGSSWVAKDKRKYNTRAWCKKCIILEMDNLFDDLTLWEG